MPPKVEPKTAPKVKPKTPEPERGPFKIPAPEVEPSRRLQPARICPSQRVRVTRRIDRELPHGD